MKAPRYLGCYDRRFLREVIPGLVVIALTFAGMMILEKGAPGRNILVGVGGVAVAYTVLVCVASIRRLDELQQRIHLIAIAASFAVTGMIVNSFQIFAKAGLPVPTLGPWLWMVMVAIWAGGLFVVGRRYK
jgi:hypothetical protein